MSSSIGIGRSFRYVAGSLGYCARRASRRGRRGSAMRWLIPSVRSHPSLPTQRPSRANATFAAPSGKQSFLRAERDKIQRILQCTRCGFASLSRVQMRRESNLQAADGGPPNDGLLVGRLVLDTVGGYLVGGDNLLAVGSNAEVISGLAAAVGWHARGVGGGRVTQPAYGGGGNRGEEGDRRPEWKALRRHRAFRLPRWQPR